MLPGDVVGLPSSARSAWAVGPDRTPRRVDGHDVRQRGTAECHPAHRTRRVRLTLRDTVRIWSYAGDPSSLTAQANDWAASGFAPSKRPDWSACHPENQVISRPHVESIWWLIAPNPFVIVADAAPLPPEARGNLETWAGRSGDPLAFLSLLTRSLSLPPSNDQDQCSWALMSDNPASRNYEVRSTSDGGAVVVDARGNVLDTGSPVPRRIITANTPIWPWGLGFSLLLGAGMFYVAVRRLSVPYGVLPKGTRVA